MDWRRAPWSLPLSQSRGSHSACHSSPRTLCRSPAHAVRRSRSSAFDRRLLLYCAKSYCANGQTAAARCGTRENRPEAAEVKMLTFAILRRLSASTAAARYASTACTVADQCPRGAASAARPIGRSIGRSAARRRRPTGQAARLQDERKPPMSAERPTDLVATRRQWFCGNA